MHFLILAIVLIILGLVMYAVGKIAKRKWVKNLSVVPVAIGIVLLLILAYYFFFVGELPATLI